MRKLQVVVWLPVAAALWGQPTRMDLRSQAKNVDFSDAASTRPVKVGAVLPAACSVGELFFRSDAAAGSNLFGCTSPDSWTPLAGGLPQPQAAGSVIVSDGAAAGWGVIQPGSGLAKTQIGLNSIWSADSATIAFLALDNAFLGNNAFAGKLFATPSASQTVTVSDAILANAGTVQITAAGVITLTSTPTIADGSQDGQRITLVNVGSNAITLQDEASLAGSNLCLAGDTNLAVAAKAAALLSWNSGASCWVQVGGSGGGGGGSGTVTSVALSMPAEFSVSGSPVTTAGTLAVTMANQSANQVFAGPTGGGAAAPGFRALVAADLPDTAVTPNSYTCTNLTVDAQGRITAASSGSCGGGGASKTILGGQCVSGSESINGLVTGYLALNCDSVADTPTTHPQNRSFLFPEAGTISKFGMVLSVVNGAGSDMTCHLQKSVDGGANWTEPGPVLVIAAGGSAGTYQDLVNTATFAAGDYARIRCVNSTNGAYSISSTSMVFTFSE